MPGPTSSFSLRRLLLLPGSVLMCLFEGVLAQGACQVSQPLTYAVVHEQPVSIDTDVLWNTTFYPFPGGAGVTVDNAPTSINSITTYLWTETKTYRHRHSRTSSAALTLPTADDSTFVMMVMGPSKHDKRQSGSYWVNANGTVTNDCTSSPIYTIRNGVLTATVNGVTYTYSTSPGVAYQVFVPSTIPGPITTWFSLSGDDQLSWTNSGFYNGEANCEQAHR